MKVDRLDLASFRGFDQIEISFEPDVTVIAGVNGVGKSSLLAALAVLVSHVVPQVSRSRERHLSLSPTDVQFGKPGLTLSAAFTMEGARVLADVSRRAPLGPGKVAELEEKRDYLRNVAFRGTRKGSKEAQEVEDQIRRLELQLNEDSDLPTVRVVPIVEDFVLHSTDMPRVPLAVLYSTKRFLTRLSVSSREAIGLDPSVAHKDALSQLEVSMSKFASWFRVLKDGGIDDPVLASTVMFSLDTAIRTFLPGMSDLQFQIGRSASFTVRKGQTRLNLDQLSDGERGLLALVFDLTRRLALANPQSINPIAEGEAIVLIDEIELHLHPKWQRQVLRHLREVFTNCQFIVTTHSPQVIGQVRASKLRLLHLNEENRVALVPVAQSFGMDSSWILQHVMGGTARDYEVEQKFSRIYDAIDASELASARDQAEALRREVGDFPDLQEATALLDRLELLGGE